MRFAGKSVIVTGGGKGIGAGCARVFMEEGGQVAILDRDRAAAELLARELNASKSDPARAIALVCDVSRPEEFSAAIDRAVAEFGRLDCLINNAGIHPPATTIDDTSVELVESVFRINFLSTFVGCKAAVRYLRATKGTIVNISSMTAVLGQDRSSAYSASKAAQVGLTKALAIELGPQGVRVNAILPSNVDTPLMREWAATLDNPAQALQRVAALQVFGRMASPEEIGRVALFLATDDSSFLTGQAIEAEGGASLDY